MNDEMTLECPKCGFINSSGKLECEQCGIIFKKYQKLAEKKEADRRELLTTCRVCQKEISKNAVSCPHCGEPCAANEKKAENPTRTETNLASYWKRGMAFILDMIVVMVGTAVIFAATKEDPDALTGIIVTVMWIYYAALESSPAQGTLGKMLLKIKVTDMDGKRIGVGKAISHGFARLFSGIFFGLGYIMVLFTQHRQCLHDMAAKCLVLNK